MKWIFKARLLEDDERTEYKAGTTFDPKGFYYNGKNVVLVGSVAAKHTIRLSFPADSVEIDVEREMSKQKPGTKWALWMKPLQGLKEGWFCGFGERQNAMLHRVEALEDADLFDYEWSANEYADDFAAKGYPCSVKKVARRGGGFAEA